MTARGWSLLIGGAALAVTGWLLGWPELSVLGVAAVAVVLWAALLSARGGSAALVLDASTMTVVRGESATVRVTVTPSRSRRNLRLLAGPPSEPAWTMPLPRCRIDAPASVRVPVDTSRRGEYDVGPFTVVSGDPWSIVRRSVGVSAHATLLVRPRIHPVRRGFASFQRCGDSEAMTRQAGDDQFFALRDYVLGDEPRSVHWRSSARSGHLVVKQRVAAATEGLLVVLDVDGSAYPSTDAFSEGFLEERFEEAVEVAASLCRARSESGLRVLLTTTARTQILLGSASFSQIINALAVVQPVPPTELDTNGMLSAAHRTRCTSLLVVTGEPSGHLVASLRRAASLMPVVVRVGGSGTSSTTALIDVSGVESLA